ncbi:hypothetical protein PROPJV5_0868 [Propionibacterium ruminifibrarum]|uniref:Uncharacterized protein n=1 Tax=Propionibacterium ruminifibrarum TaxID=1962131 RepID=A0A375I3Z7_9ACTN|nr:hypothetical protein [Propionibacterium ruminifibrarum]SPF67913.1 hypothetical protein PROPJV5_0868 [Propionibacterium ruminifibrarum]
MGISDELRDLAATPPEATAMSASLADQAVGFAIKARRVARMKIAAAVTAGAIATTGVAIGVVTSNDNSDLPVSTPVVTITPSSASPSQSSSASPSSSPTQSESPEQSASPSDAPILVQPSQPELEPAGPGTDPNILEEILETLRSLPERIIEALRPGSPSGPDSRNGDEDSGTSEPSLTPSNPTSPESPSASQTEAPSPSSPASSASESSAPPSSATPSPEPSDPICKVREERRGAGDEYFFWSERKVDCDQEPYKERLEKAKESSSPAESPSGNQVCVVIEEQDGKETARATIPCGGAA